MTTSTLSKLDIEKFRKVWALAEGGATEGERTAAHARATAMAARSGMTLTEALSKMDADSMAADPNAAFREARRRNQAAKSARYAGRRADLLKRFGDMKAVFDPRPIETALFVAATPFAIRMEYEDYCGTKRWYSSVLGGAMGFMDRRKVNEACKDAIRNAWPIPDTLSALLAEARLWDDIWRDRQAFVAEIDDHEYEMHAEGDCRRDMIEHELNTRPVTCWDDMRARFDWKRFEWERQWLDPTEESEDGTIPTLRRDFDILRRMYETPAQNGQGDGMAPITPTRHRTNADKRRDVLSMLEAEPNLSDREIGRRCGVSPQTVGNLRRGRSRSRERAA